MIKTPSVSLSPRRMAKMVDALGALNAQISKLQAEAELLKVSLKACEVDEVIGAQYRARISTSESKTLDTAKAKGFLTLAQIEACSKVVKRTSITLYDL
jgi:hypothetical protein